jgi:hypothetical protein
MLSALERSAVRHLSMCGRPGENFWLFRISRLIGQSIGRKYVSEVMIVRIY